MAKKLWSYSCGQRGVNRVRVYERSVSPVIYVEWYWRGNRKQRSLKSETGHPVTSRPLAKKIAHEVASRIKQDHNLAARSTIFGYTHERTLSELLAAYHGAKEPGWSHGHFKGMRRRREFWQTELGDVQLAHINAATVEAVAQTLAFKPETIRKYLVYMKGAYRFAVLKLKWLDARHDLSAVDLPKGQGESKPYSMAEVRKLLPAMERVGDGAGWMAHVAWQSGRRLNAIRTLAKASVDTRDGYSVLTFPGETDKARNTGEVVVVDRAHALTVELMAQPGDYVLGVEPPKPEMCIRTWVRQAETLAGIRHIDGRAWHGLKRQFATVSDGIKGRAKQSGTSEETLRKVYLQDDLEPKKAVAEALAVALTVSN